MTKYFTPLLITFLSLTTALQAQTWQQETGLPGSNNARHHPVTWAIGDYGYVLTGTTSLSNASKDFYEYDAPNDSWQQLTDFPGSARSFAIGDAYNGKGYIGFGMTGNGTMLKDLWSYDTASGNWNQLASCPCPGRKHPTFSINEKEEKIYVGKGDNGQSNFRDWWEYDIATNQWSKLPDFPGIARHHPFHFSIGDYTYTGLGHGPSIYSDLYRFDPSDSSWKAMAFAPGPRVAGTEFNYGGYGFVLSGDGAGHQPTDPPAFWGYNPSADAWISLPPHPGTSRWAPGSFVIDGILYFTCGEDGANGQLKSDLWSFDLQTILSNQEFSKLVFSVFPNPTTGLIHLSSPYPLSQSTLKIYSLDGRMVHEQEFEKSIDLGAFPRGVYILEVINGSDEISRARVVKE